MTEKARKYSDDCDILVYYAKDALNSLERVKRCELPSMDEITKATIDGIIHIIELYKDSTAEKFENWMWEHLHDPEYFEVE